MKFYKTISSIKLPLILRQKQISQLHSFYTTNINNKPCLFAPNQNKIIYKFQYLKNKMSHDDQKCHLATQNPQFTNRLSKEESPYLLQHAHNPVDWYPWSNEAFEKAKNEDKPIFLSVGYSTCHWCHVMEHESFENENIAKILNENFISIKVDKEERPDVDKVYMLYVTATTGHGGWPMSVFLTPELKPMFGGTYFPSVSKYGMPSFAQVLYSIIKLWHEKKEDIKEESNTAILELSKAALSKTNIQKESDVNRICKDALEKISKTLFEDYDGKFGGFSHAPKFPRPSEINVLMKQYLVKKSLKATREYTVIYDMIMNTLNSMSYGGIYDHIGGGFHRYSVDECWHVPHFEKMLYDNPQIALTYLEAFKIEYNPYYLYVVCGILDYLIRDMINLNEESFGVYSAEDADSYDGDTGKKTEGAFYLWSYKDIEKILSGSDSELFKIFSHHYHVKKQGNCNRSKRSDPHKEFVGKNCLSSVQAVRETALDLKKTEDEINEILAKGRKLIFDQRQKRMRPGLDNKIVSSWNGMAISAFALASRVLKSKESLIKPYFPVEGRDPKYYLNISKQIGEFIMNNLWDEDNGILYRSYCKNRSDVHGFADDYANVIQGFLDIYECTGEIKYINMASKLQDKMDTYFWDNIQGGYYSTSGNDKSILMRLKEDYDSAEPSASSISLSNLIRLYSFFPEIRVSEGRETYETRYINLIKSFSHRLQTMPSAVPQMISASYLLLKSPLIQIIILGPIDNEKTQHLFDTVHSVLVPDKYIILMDPNDEEMIEYWKMNNNKAYMIVSEYLKGEKKMEGPLVFVCRNFTCKKPTDDDEEIKELLLGDNVVSVEKVNLNDLKLS